MANKPERDTADNSLKWLRAEWRYLALLTFEADPSALAPLMPPGTELDPWEGKHFVTVNGMVCSETRWMGIRVPGLGSYPRVSLGTYVRRKADDGWRRGIAAFRMVQPKIPRGWLGRFARDEGIEEAPVTHSVHFEPEGKISRAVVEYRWEWQGKPHALKLTTTGAADSAEAFAWEKYVAGRPYLYARNASGQTVETLVEHPPWFFWEAASASLEGPALAPWLKPTPDSALLVKGSPVALSRPRKI